MSGTASVPNSFANAVTATGAQLDANYNTIVAYINDPTNRNNYAVDGAATNTVVLTFAPPVVGGYTAGLELTWKWGATNTGAVVVNANGLGNAALVNLDGSALAAGAGVAGSIGKAVYDGTRFVFLASAVVGNAASQAQMQTATASNVFATPQNVVFSPAAAKAWGSVTATYGIAAGFGVASATSGGQGTCTVVLSSAMDSTTYPVLCSALASGNVTIQTVGRTTTSFVVIIRNAANAAQADIDFGFVVYGTRA